MEKVHVFEALISLQKIGTAFALSESISLRA